MAWDYKKWYKENREELLKKRKAKYRKNKKYRAKVIEASKEWYHTSPLSKKNTQESKPRQRFPRRNGDLHSIGTVSEAINRSIQTIRDYHRTGVIPKPKHTDKRNWRLYTDYQMDLLEKTFRQFDAGKLKNLKQVSIALAKNWRVRNVQSKKAANG
jgi:hypothetical protein